MQGTWKVIVKHRRKMDRDKERMLKNKSCIFIKEELLNDWLIHISLESAYYVILKCIDDG